MDSACTRRVLRRTATCHLHSLDRSYLAYLLEFHGKLDALVLRLHKVLDLSSYCIHAYVIVRSL